MYVTLRWVFWDVLVCDWLWGDLSDASVGSKYVGLKRERDRGYCSATKTGQELIRGSQVTCWVMSRSGDLAKFWIEYRLKPMCMEVPSSRSPVIECVCFTSLKNICANWASLRNIFETHTTTLKYMWKFSVHPVHHSIYQKYMRKTPKTILFMRGNFCTVGTPY